MDSFGHAPFLRLLLPFMAGILAAFSLGAGLPVSVCLFFLILLFIALGVFSGRRIKGLKRDYIFTSFTYLLLALSGYMLTLLHTGYLRPDDVSNLKEQKPVLRIRISSPVSEKEKTFRALAEAVAVKQGNNWVPVCGNVLVYFRKDTGAGSLAIGDELLLHATIHEIAGPPNPGMFDFKKYMAGRNTGEELFAGKNDWALLRHSSQSGLSILCNYWREKLLGIFRKSGLKGDELGVGSALLLGYEDKLDPELLSAYSDSGVLHVLSVSGLHVAIVFAVFNAMLFFLNPYPGGRWIKLILLFGFIWAYALLSGLSPSVMRSAAMLSFMVVGKNLNRPGNIWNTLAVSAFFLLSFNPYLLKDIGFQLSYLAVAGIVLLQPVLEKTWKAKGKIAQKAAALFAVSVAAQLATLPLILVYFHQFPSYFLVTNLVVIPLSTLVMYSGLSVLLCSSIPYVGFACSWLFSHLLQVLNGMVRFFANLPGAVIRNIHLSPAGGFILFLVLLFLAAFLYYRKTYQLAGCIALLILLFTCSLMELNSPGNRFMLNVYQFPKGSVFEVISRNTGWLYADSSVRANKQARKFYLDPCRANLGLHEPIPLPTTGALQLFVFHHKRILHYPAGLICHSLPGVDYLIVSDGNGPVPLNTGRWFYVILDSSCKPATVRRWKAELAKRRLTCWLVSEKGAFQADLSPE